MNIPDANFKAALLAHDPIIDTNGDNEIQVSEAQALTNTLDVGEAGITDVTGLEAFTNIKRLSIYNNSISSLDLSANTQINYLIASVNPLTSLDVSALPLLDTLSAMGLNISGTVDFSSNTALRFLVVGSPNWTSIDLSANTELRVFFINSANISTVDLTNNDKLISLQCFVSPISSVTIPNQSVIENIYFLNTALTSLNLGNTPSLATLTISNDDAISNLNFSGNTSLTSVTISGSDNLAALDLSDNSILESVSVTSNSLLSTLNLSNGNNTGITSFNVSNNPSLACISVDDVGYAEVNFTVGSEITFEEDCNNPTIQFVDENLLTAILNDNPSIDSNVDGKIGEAEAAAYSGSLDLSGSNITYIGDIELFTGLTGINLDANPLVAADLSQNTSLASFSCVNCQLRVLDVANGNNTNFTSFNVTGNADLTCVNVDDQVYSTNNWTNKPAGTSYSNDCIVTIPNAEFKSQLLMHTPDIDLDDNGEIELSEARGLTGRLTAVGSTAITDVIGLEAFSNITELFLYSNDIQSIDLSQNTAVTEFRAFNNANLAQLDVSNMKDLDYFYVTGTSIGELDLSKNEKLTTIFCSQNDLTSLDISNATGLTFLSAGLNDIKSIDLSSNTQLDEIYLNQNDLSSLDLTNITGFSSINITSNFNLQCVHVDNITYAESRITYNGSTYLSESACPPAIPDSKLRMALLNHTPMIDTNEDGILQFEEIDTYSDTLFLGFKLISDLTGLEYFTNIIGLELNNNSFTSIDLSPLTSLEYLNLSGVGSIPPIDLTSNANIRSLKLNGNAWTTLDLSANQLLTDLELKFQPMTSIDLSNNTMLEYLDLENCDLASVNLSNNTALRELNVKGNPLGGLDLSQNTSLEVLDARFMQFGAFDFSTNTNLRYLRVDNNPNLNSIDLTNNSNLEYFNGRSCDLNSITFGNHPNLTSLYISENALTSLDLSTLTSLEWLGIYNNVLTELDLSNQPNLAQLDAYENQLISLDLSSNTALVEVYVENNLLSSLNLNGLTSLEILYAYNNQITEIDFSTNSSLRDIDIYENQIEFIDLSQNPLVTSFYAYDNNLFGLNIANGANEAINDLDATLNPNLLCVTVDDVTYAETNFTMVDAGMSFSTNCGNYENDILGFDVTEAAESPVIDQVNHAVNLEVTAGTDITSITPTISLSQGASISPGSEMAQDFSTNVVYTVTSEDGRDQDWTVTVTEQQVAPTEVSISASDINENNAVDALIGTLSSVDLNPGDNHTYTLVSGIGDTDNGSFNIVGDELRAGDVFNFETKGSYSIRVETNDGNGGLFEKQITININDVNELPSDIMLSNTTIDESSVVGTLVGVLTTTDEDFGQTYTYSLVTGFGDTDNSSFNIIGSDLVSSEIFDFETKTSYTVRIQTNDGNGGTFEKDFAISINDLPASITSVDMDNTSIDERMPSGSNVGNLSTTGEQLSGSFTYSLVPGIGDDDNSSFSISGDVLQSATEFDFESKNNYLIRVKTDDGNGQTKEVQFTITVNDVFESTDANISSFELAEQTGPAVIDAISQSISLEVTYGTDFTQLNPMIEISGAASISHTGVQDFSEPFTYTVTAEDATTTREWVVTVTVALNTATDILTFELAEQTGTTMVDALRHEISLIVAYGTDLTVLEPTINVSEGALISPTGLQDFSSTFTYTVTAQDGVTTQDWTVSIEEALNTETDILSFSLAQEIGTASINTTNHTVTIEVVSGTDVTQLEPTITISPEATISPSVVQDFTIPVTYTVTAQDGSIQEWTVTVSIAPNNANSITSFSFVEESSSATIDAVNGTVNILVIFGTDLTSLSPTIGISASASINPEGGLSRDFTNPVEYIVTAEDGTSKTWTVTVNIASNTANDILRFEIGDQSSETFIDSENHTVTLEMPFGSNLTSLTPMIHISDNAAIDPDSEVTRDFSDPVTYQVTSESGSVQDWIVTVTEAPSNLNDILSFQIDGQVRETEIDTETRSIAILVKPTIDISSLIPIVTVSDGATISPDTDSPIDFSDPVEFTVTAANGDQAKWLVRVIKDALGLEGMIEVNAYPNPTTDILTVDFRQGAKDLELRLMDLNGREIHSSDLDGRVQIDMTSLPEGLYILRVLNIKQETIYNNRIVKSR